MQRIEEKLIRRCKLNQLTEIHDADTVGEILYDRKVMRDEKNGKSQLASQIVKQVDDLRLDRNVKCGNRLVGDYHFRLHYYRTCNAYSLTLTAGKFMLITSCVLTHKPDKLQHFVDLLVDDLFVLLALYYQSFGYYLTDGKTRVKGG